MARGTISLVGVKELIAKLDSFTPERSRAIFRKALREAARPIQAEAKRLAPRGKTGQLQRSIKIRAGKRRAAGVSMLVQTAAGDFKGKTFYGAFLEYGTKERTTKRGKNLGRVKAVEFMKQAFDNRKSEAEAIVETELTQGIVQELAR